MNTASQYPAGVRDTASWVDVKELDEHGENLTQWEVDFVASLISQLLEGRHLTRPQQARLEEIREQRL